MEAAEKERVEFNLGKANFKPHLFIPRDLRAHSERNAASLTNRAIFTSFIPIWTVVRL